MPDSDKLKDLEATLKSLNAERDRLKKQIAAEQWLIVQEETGVQEGSIVSSDNAEYKVVGLNNYWQYGDHFLDGRKRQKNGEFSKQIRTVWSPWTIVETTDA